MSTVLHTKEQGLRVHKLASLGGLVALAGLEYIEPALLLGVFMQIADQLPQLGLQQVSRLRETGLQKLNARKKEKEQYQLQKPVTIPHLTETTLKLEQIKVLITRLGGKVPVLEKDIVPELHRLMR